MAQNLAHPTFGAGVGQPEFGFGVGIGVGFGVEAGVGFCVGHGVGAGLGCGVGLTGEGVGAGLQSVQRHLFSYCDMNLQRSSLCPTHSGWFLPFAGPQPQAPPPPGVGEGLPGVGDGGFFR